MLLMSWPKMKKAQSRISSPIALHSTNINSSLAPCLTHVPINHSNSTTLASTLSPPFTDSSRQNHVSPTASSAGLRSTSRHSSSTPNSVTTNNSETPSTTQPPCPTICSVATISERNHSDGQWLRPTTSPTEMDCSCLSRHHDERVSYTRGAAIARPRMPHAPRPQGRPSPVQIAQTNRAAALNRRRSVQTSPPFPSHPPTPPLPHFLPHQLIPPPPLVGVIVLGPQIPLDPMPIASWPSLTEVIMGRPVLRPLATN